MRISVKQICMFGDRIGQAIGGCPRQWGFNYLDKFEVPFLAPQLVDGIKFHACVEHLHRDGVMPESQELQPGVVLTPQDVSPEGHFGRMARAALIHIPGNESVQWMHEYEGFFPWRTTNGVEVEIHLRPDLMSKPALGLLGYLIDFKSCNGKKHALTLDGGKKPIRDDVQANTYSYGLSLLSSASTLARWIYVDRNTYAAWPVERMFCMHQTEAWMHENIDATIELIHAIRSRGELTAMDLPGDERACDSGQRFCDHISRCLGPVGAKPSRLITLEEVTRYIGKTE